VPTGGQLPSWPRRMTLKRAIRPAGSIPDAARYAFRSRQRAAGVGDFIRCDQSSLPGCLCRADSTAEHKSFSLRPKLRPERAGWTGTRGLMRPGSDDREIQGVYPPVGALSKASLASSEKLSGVLSSSCSVKPICLADFHSHDDASAFLAAAQKRPVTLDDVTARARRAPAAAPSPWRPTASGFAFREWEFDLQHDMDQF